MQVRADLTASACFASSRLEELELTVIPGELNLGCQQHRPLSSPDHRVLFVSALYVCGRGMWYVDDSSNVQCQGNPNAPAASLELQSHEPQHHALQTRSQTRHELVKVGQRWPRNAIHMCEYNDKPRCVVSYLRSSNNKTRDRRSTYRGPNLAQQTYCTSHS